MTETDTGRIGRVSQSKTTAHKILTNLIKTPSATCKNDVLPPLSPYLLEHIKVQDHINLKARGLTA